MHRHDEPVQETSVTWKLNYTVPATKCNVIAFMWLNRAIFKVQIITILFMAEQSIDYTDYRVSSFVATCRTDD